MLGAAIALLLGLLGMLLLRRERVFARVAARPGGGGTVLTLASLTRGSGENGPRFAALSDDLARRSLPDLPRTGGLPRVTPDASLAALSNTFFSVSVALYSLAVVAFCAQLAFGRRPGPRARGRGGDRAAPAPAGPETEQGRRWGQAALALTVLGAVAHAAVLVTRGLATERLPWGNMYEFATATVLVAVVAYVVLAVRSPGLRHIGLFVLAPRGALARADRPVPLRRGGAAGGRAALELAGRARHHRDPRLRDLLRQRDRQRAVPGPGAVRVPGRRRGRAPGRASSPGCRTPRRWTGSPTAPPSSGSRSGRSRSSPAPSGRRAPGAASGAGTPRRPGPSSPGSSTPRTCTRGRPPGGAGAPRPGSTSSAWS